MSLTVVDNDREIQFRRQFELFSETPDLDVFGNGS